MSQNSLVLPTSGTLSGLAAVQGVNAALDTLNTLACGASAPASPEAGQLWHDTGNKLLKIRAMDNTSWIVIGTLDETNYLFKAAGLSATLPIATGGTGATTQAAALTALLGSSIVPQANGGTGQNSVAALWSASLTTNGYEVSPSGRITQWGTTGIFVPGASGVVTYPMAFPNNTLSLQATLIEGSGGTNSSASAYSPTASAFNLVNNSNVGSAIYWHAEGY